MVMAEHQRARFQCIPGGKAEGVVPEPVSPLVDETITLVRNIDAGFVTALQRSKLDGTMPRDAKHQFDFLDQWLRYQGRGHLTHPQEVTYDPFGPVLTTEKWRVETHSGEPRVLIRFAYMTGDMKEGYAYFVQPVNAPVDNAVAYQSEGVGDKKTWHQTDLTASIGASTYLQVLKNSNVRMVDIAAYLIDFPSGGGGGLEFEEDHEELLAA